LPFGTVVPFAENSASFASIAYVYAVRSLAVSDLGSIPSNDMDRQEAKRLISQLVPFLTDRKSTTLHRNLTAVVVDLRSRFEKDNSETFCLLLRDVAQLMRPSPVTIISQTNNLDSHPLHMILRLLSDLCRLYTDQTAVNHKLVFYAAHAVATGPEAFRVVSQEVLSRSITDAETVEDTTVSNLKPSGRLPLIEELEGSDGSSLTAKVHSEDHHDKLCNAGVSEVNEIE